MATKTRDDIQDTYSRGADEYDRVRERDPRGQLVSGQDLRIFGRLFPKQPGDLKVVEVGAGTGRFTIPVLERGFHLIATDFNEEMLENLRTKVAERGWEDRCEVKTDDIFHLSFADETIDYLFAIHVIPRFGSLQDQRDAINEVARTLKPGGRFLFNYSNRSSLWGKLYKGHAARASDMRRILEEAGMRIEAQRGKWFVNRTLINRLPLPLGHGVAAIDRLMTGVWTNRAWDVFVVAVKDG